jgi:ferredoxin
MVLATAVVLAWPDGSDSAMSVVLPSLSPLIAAACAIGAPAVGLTTLLALPVAILSLVDRRWFCRYACPVGLLLDGVGRIRPKTRKRRLRLSMIGRGLALLALGGAMVGYPLFLWLDPLAIFNGFLNAWRQPIALATLLTGIGLPVLLLINIIVPRVWCPCICPLGATQDLFFGLRSLFRMKAQSLEPDRTVGMTNISQGRRGFLAVCVGAAGGFALKAVRGQASPLRPPGSVDGDRFTGICVRCGNCAQICPSKIIRPDFIDSGIRGLLTPRLCFDEDYCREDCRRCNQVCPSGAIAHLSLEDKRRRVIGRAVVDLDNCLLAKGRECTACIRQCPYEAIAMQSLDDGFSNSPRVDPGRCNGCGACEAICPTRPVRAIGVRSAKPGSNSF